ncbi:hypothetical protein EDC02_0937 [Micromonospora sp. Llam0]|uniref:hypothetical protein n=1 Tax=Micromonospora sp. Llam0 TaxID=2485143 RepID=UPI000F4AAE1A|nr:hypothetical protein [Micromonospora sp. Llam0]ROO59149.1 hypothetical protein EDC02_0937 [Micromonospora sp. Llam0]
MITVPVGRTRSTPASGPTDRAAGAQSGPFGPVIGTGGTDPAVLIPVSSGGRPLGVFVCTAGRVRYRPVVAADRVAAAAAAVAVAAVGAAAVAAVARRRPAAVGTVTMGPGGWVSFKGLPGPAPRVVADGRRPWWARLLRARRLSR